MERTSPGLSALFESLREDRGHSILDLGPAGNRHLKVFGPFAQQIRFAGLVPGPPRADELAPALESIPPNPEQPYDVVLAWDILDRLDAEERPVLVDWIDRLTAPGARLYTVVESTGAETTQPLQLTALEVGRVLQETVGPPEPAHPQLLPAHVERLLVPFEVVHAFSLRLGLREYVAQKP